MIARLWTTRIDPARGRAYDAFAEAHSRPMFAALPGCLGARFLGSGDVRTVFSLWTDAESIAAAEASTLYQETVAQFRATGILREPQNIAMLVVTGGNIDTAALAARLSPNT